MLGLQYQSLKAVLPHMDANTRFRISLHMPSIRSVEKMLPLKIYHLRIQDFSVKINNTRYQLGVLRHYPNGNAPRPIKEERRRGAIEYDFDEFGFPVPSGRNILLPGDVSFVSFEWEERFDTEEYERTSREELRALEKALETLTELKSKGITVEDHLESLEPLPDEFDEEFEEEYTVEQFLSYPSDTLLSCIDKQKLKLLPFECRRNRTKPPFTYYIQLTITKGKSTRIQRFEYTKKLFEAVKHFNERFFGGRTMPIRVESFDFTFPHGVFRLPVGFRLRANRLHVRRPSLRLRKLHSLVENSKILDCLWIHSGTSPNGFQRRIVRNAKKLVLADVLKSLIQELLPSIRDLRHRDVLILPWPSQFLPEDYFQIIDAWLSGNRQIGANCWIRVVTDEMARDILKLVRTRNERTKRTKRCVTIQRNDSTRVEVFYVPFRKQIKYYGFYHGDQIMKIRIVKA